MGEFPLIVALLAGALPPGVLQGELASPPAPAVGAWAQVSPNGARTAPPANDPTSPPLDQLPGASPSSSAQDAAPVPPTDGPRVHRVEPGLAWHLIAMDAKPGDQILLEKGFHINAQVHDLHGTRENPIVIRGADPAFPSAVVCEERGVELVRCSWVRLENLFFLNPTEAAIVVDGTRPSAASDETAGDDSLGPVSEVSIAIAGCRISASREMPGMDAIRVINAKTVGIVDCHFEAWSDTAIELRNAHGVVITRNRFSPRPDSARQHAVRALDGSRTVAVMQNTFEGGIGTGVQIGNCDADSEAISGRGATEVHVLRSTFLEVQCPVSISGGSTGSLRESTVIDATALYRVDARCGVPSLTLGGNIFTWEPSVLRVVADRLGDAEASMVTLDANLWWSRELPMAFEVVGHPFGTEKSPQITTIDPRLSDRGFEPMEERAKTFGWLAPPPAPLVPVEQAAPAGNPPQTSPRSPEVRE
ncbi:MAG: right-handed parallel beta-helix repeat-containing protein [Phycisphaeraceae bacterium]|nr:right-handed parallel beta-helix repeat-containing protein [Phycisphaeraceae bacterium]